MLSQDNVHVSISNACVFHWLRAVLYQMPVEKRPQVRWMVNGEEMVFDENLRSTNWLSGLDTEQKALEILLGDGYQ